MTALSVAMAAVAAVERPELEAAESDGAVVSAGPAVGVVDVAGVGAGSSPLSIPVVVVDDAVSTGPPMRPPPGDVGWGKRGC
jgi:hypothetical protein